MLMLSIAAFAFAVPTPPRFVAGKKLSREEAWTALQELQALSPKIYLAPLVASGYCEVQERWIDELSGWVKENCSPIRDFAPETPANACHAFATTVRFATQFASLVTSDDVPLVATVYLTNKQAWGKVIGYGDIHAVVIFRTAKGWVIMESQNGTWAYLKSYPNRGNLVFASVH